MGGRYTPQRNGAKPEISLGLNQPVNYALASLEDPPVSDYLIAPSILADFARLGEGLTPCSQPAQTWCISMLWTITMCPISQWGPWSVRRW